MPSEDVVKLEVTQTFQVEEIDTDRVISISYGYIEITI